MERAVGPRSVTKVARASAGAAQTSPPQVAEQWPLVVGRPAADPPLDEGGTWRLELREPLAAKADPGVRTNPVVSAEARRRRVAAPARARVQQTAC
jgi:hypothetical protein